MQGSPEHGLALDDAHDTRQELISRSHDRSRSFGLDPTLAPSFDALSTPDLRELVDRNRALKSHAAPIMESLYENIINTHSMVLLTDAQGTILHALGDDDFLQRAQKVALAPGVCWSEQAKGTNAIGTALIEAAPTVVHANDHFLRANHFLTCSATPIFHPTGAAIGVLDVTGDFRSYHKHTMALVRMSAQIIENQLFDDAFPDAIRVHFHARPEFVGTLMEGIAVFDQDGRYLAGNRGAIFQFGQDAKALQRQTFSSLFGISIAQLRDHHRTMNPTAMTVRLSNGLIVSLKADLRRGGYWAARAGDVAESTAAPASVRRDACRPGESAAARANRLSSLRYLNTGDPQMALVIDRVQKIMGRDIPIMIVGETGTGKELLAQAIHNDSPRASMPFVAVNCASIPESLIESELFGYEDGAFTGARKRGAQGKILAANGGTLFLDEIGDMPAHLQARLLRVLQERAVTPLGGSKETVVNVMVICATNRNLRDLIAKSAFREDLYYRLNGLVVKLPPLRQRTDLAVIVQKILQNESRGGVPRIASQVLDVFARYRWPGNFRQLTNVLRTACVMAEGEATIDLGHLPEDFLEDLALQEPAAAPAPQEIVEQVRASLNAAPVAPMPPIAPMSVVPTLPDHPSSTIAASPPCTAPPRAYAGVAPSVPPEPSTVGQSLEEIERTTIESALRRHNGNVSAAARMLGISRNTIYRKVPAAHGRGD